MQKSSSTRIKRAEEGKCTARNVYGRDWDENAKRYVAKPEYVAMLSQAMAELDRGETVRAVAAQAGISRFQLHKALKNAGTTISYWLGSKAYPKTFPRKQYTIQVPPLVRDLAALQRVLIRLEGNSRRFRLSKQNTIDHDYILSGLVFCKTCNLRYAGNTIRWKNKADSEYKRGPDGKRLRKRKKGTDLTGYRRYYRHNVDQRLPHCCFTRREKGEEGAPPFALNINAIDLEVAVLEHLFKQAESLGKLRKLVKKLDEANGTDKDRLKKEFATLEARLAEIQKAKRRLIDNMAKVDDDPDLTERFNATEAEIAKLEQRLGERRMDLDTLPDSQVLTERAERFKERFEDLLEAVEHLDGEPATPEFMALTLPRPEARAFLKSLLDEPGHGIYVSKHADGLLSLEIRASNYPKFSFKM